MKKYINILIMLFLTVSFSSCLKSNLEDLPEYGDADITTVSRVEYRYTSSDVSAASNQKIEKFVTMKNISSINAATGNVTITVTLPANFPAEQLSDLSASKLAVIVGLSTAARISPVRDAPQLGVTGDWSKASSYIVTAADGTQKNWTITVILNK